MYPVRLQHLHLSSWSTKPWSIGRGNLSGFEVLTDGSAEDHVDPVQTTYEGVRGQFSASEWWTGQHVPQALQGGTELLEEGPVTPVSSRYLCDARLRQYQQPRPCVPCALSIRRR